MSLRDKKVTTYVRMVFPQKQLTKGHLIAMNSITHFVRYLPHTIYTRYYSVKIYRGGALSILYVESVTY